MDPTAQLTAVLQALLVGVTALLQTHPDPSTVRKAFETIAARSSADQPTLDVLRRAIR